MLEGTQQANAQGTIECPNCNALLPQEMLFCRMCGTRLVEGSVTDATTGNLGQPARFTASPAAQFQVKRKKGPHWIVWTILGIVIASFIGGALLRPTSRIMRSSPMVSSSSNQSRAGIASYNTIGKDEGAMIQSVGPPDSPADKAGLVGGDIITGFDGKPIRKEDDLQNAIRSTPLGKTVEVVYTRDGETKKTNLTTVNEDEIDRLRDIYDDTRKGFLGVDDMERVPVANSNIYGVRVGDVLDNRAAFFGDMKEGDIVTEFNGTPIRTPEEFESRIRRTKPLSIVKIIVMRDGQKVELNIKMGKS